MTIESWGRFTIAGDNSVEDQIRRLIHVVRELVASHVAPEKYRALLLIGGYGRGEGGVETRNGVQFPHNNLDFLLITDRCTTDEANALKRILDAELEQLERDHGVGIDLGTISLATLRNSSCLVMFYDMRHGHKTILGDSEVLRSMSKFSVDRILPSDMRWLLVNRGAQLIVNDILLGRADASIDDRRYVIKLAIKAVIGYGDALLFSLGDYHWSYQEKARRMESNAKVPESFRRFYGEAVRFRFEPRYGEFLQRDLVVWMSELREVLESVHIQFESIRLKRNGWSWEDYPSLSLRSGITEELSNVRSLARRAVNLFRGPSAPNGTRLIERIGYRVAGHRGLLPICFPVIVYGLENKRLRAWSRFALGARDTSIEALRTAFLESWGRLVDPNFFKVARRLELHLSEQVLNI